MLLKEEKIQIIKMILESYKGVTITEVKSNNDIKREIESNFKYYEVLKEIFNIPNGLIKESILSIFGNIKDFLTGSEIVKNIVSWIQEKITKIIQYFSSKFGPYIPEPVKKGGKWIGNAAKTVSEWVKWLLSAFTYKGLAKLFAMIKFRTFKPTDEQKNCMVILAKKVYVAIIIGLVIAYLIKIGPVVVSYLATKGGAAISANSLNPIIAPITSLFKSAGIEGAAAKMAGPAFGAFSAILKTKSAVKKSKEINKKEETYEIDSQGKNMLEKIKGEFKEYYIGWKEAWNKCDNKGIKESYYKYRLI